MRALVARLLFLSNKRALLAVTLAILGCSAAHAHEGRLVVLHSFCSEANCRDGQTPEAGLVADGHGALYGTASFGGAHSGVVFALIPNADRTQWAYRVLHDFCARPICRDGAVVFGPLVVDSAGGLYGVTTVGGRGNAGVLFKLTPNASQTSWTYTILHDVCPKQNSCDLQTFNFGLTYAGASDGAPYDGTSPLYGMTMFGGYLLGNVYSLTPRPDKTRWSLRQIYAFCTSGGSCDDGELPWGEVVVEGDGQLYGTVQGGGANGQGAVFNLKPQRHQWIESTAYSFCADLDCADGQNPAGALLVDSTGNFFGVAGAGDSSCAVPPDCGVVFKLTPSARENVLHRFCQEPDCRDGRTPIGPLVIDADANLIGTTFNGGGYDSDDEGKGGGTVFKLGRSFDTKYRFCRKDMCTDGEYPWGDIVLDGQGRIFGTTQRGGAHNAGEVFALMP